MGGEARQVDPVAAKGGFQCGQSWGEQGSMIESYKVSGLGRPVDSKQGTVFRGGQEQFWSGAWMGRELDSPEPISATGALEDDRVAEGDGDCGGSEDGLAAGITELPNGDQGKIT